MIRLFGGIQLAVFVGAFCSLWIASAPADPASPTNGYGYRVESAFGGLVFQEPTAIVFAPGETKRGFVVERAGTVALLADLDHPTRSVFLDLTSRVGNGGSDHGMLSLAFHPQFAQNGYFFLWYSMIQDGQRYNRLARFKVSSTDPSHADPASEYPLITQHTGPGGHDGGTILFGADGYLYLSIGDGDENDQEAIDSHQHIDRSFFGAVIRIDVDQRPTNLSPNPHPSVHPGTYRVPADNPFVGATSFNGSGVSSSAVRTEFWAVGLRNPFRMSFDATTGRLWCADVGLDSREEVDLLTVGGNYGWDFREGSIKGPSTATPPASPTFIDPIWEYAHDQGLSITGGLVYRGDSLAGLKGTYIFSDFVSGRIWALVDNGDRPLHSAQITQIAQEAGLVSYAQDPRQGDLLMADLDSNVIRRLTVDPIPPDLASSRLINLSSRALVGTGDDVLIAGFIISGTPKTVLVRAIGPGLTAYGVSGVLNEPILTLYRNSEVLASNHGWETSANLSELKLTTGHTGAVPLAAGIADCALVATLQPGAYTAIASGAAGKTGVALVELFEADTDPTVAGRLFNLSARARVASGDSILITGVIVSGTKPRTVLIRASGPALLGYGVSSVLNKPRLALYSGSQEVSSNVGWINAPNLTDLRAATSHVGATAFPDGSADCAMVVTLLPGAYTLEVSGADGGGGIALVETFEIQ